MHKSLTAALVITLGVGVALAQPAGVRPDLSAEDLERVRQVTAPTADFSTPENFEAMSAGAGTVRKLVNQDVFSFSLANLSFEQEERFKLGNALFRKLWVSSPSSTEASDGLGPLFNARGCQNCHLKDGRGHLPHGDGRESAVSMFLRLSVPAGNEAEQALLDSTGPMSLRNRPMAAAGFRGAGAEGRGADAHRLCRSASDARRRRSGHLAQSHLYDQ